MLNAKEALLLKENGDRKRANLKQKEYKEAQADAKRRAEKALRVDLPGKKKEVEARIIKATEAGYLETALTLNTGAEGDALADALKDYLEGNGYSVQIHHRSGTTDYGDWSNIEVAISWKPFERDW